jgi:hypothetical protein
MTKTSKYEPAEHSVETPTFRLRWVERFTFRDLKQGGVEPVQDRVLQQAWQDQSTRAITWRDVPVEKE